MSPALAPATALLVPGVDRSRRMASDDRHAGDDPSGPNERITPSPLGVAQRRHHVRRADDGLEGGAQAAYRLGRAGFASGCPVRGREPMRLPARITRERWCGSPVREPNADGVLPGVSASGWTPRRDEP